MKIPLVRYEIPRWIVIDLAKDALYGVFAYAVLIALGYLIEYTRWGTGG